MKILQPVNTKKAVKEKKLQQGKINSREHSVLTVNTVCE